LFDIVTRTLLLLRMQAVVGEAVDEEVDAGVQVREQWGVEVNGQRKHVRLVGQKHDDVRCPADAERDENDEEKEREVERSSRKGLLESRLQSDLQH